jgi:hypothetical protein
MWPVEKSTNVSEEHVSSIFRVEEQVNQKTSMKQEANFLSTVDRLHGVVPQKRELFKTTSVRT